MSETTISVISSKSLLTLFGARDQHVRKIRDALGVNITAQDGLVQIEGPADAVASATEVLERLQAYAHRHGSLESDDVTLVLNAVLNGHTSSETPPIEVFKPGRQIRPKSAGQARFIDAIRQNDIVFCYGPAGTGKTYLAVAMAASALKKESVRKIVLVRPAVEAGESLGYLPGDLQAKINPYLRPLMDALHEMIDHDLIKRYTEEDLIEVIPLAYMRGRTLNEAFIILDEAQNTTVSQMKMFLTRMGAGSKIVVSGDITQIDLPPHTHSGLVDALARLRGIKGIVSVSLSSADIVRHPLVQRIVDAYDEHYVIYKDDDNYFLEATSTNAGRPGAGGTFRETYGTAALPLNTWTYLAVTYDRVTLRLYVNGGQVSSVAATGAIATSTNPLTIGGNTHWGDWFQGMIDEVRIYNRALTQAEIQADMAGPVR